jgi:hypothetical protein
MANALKVFSSISIGLLLSLCGLPAFGQSSANFCSGLFNASAETQFLFPSEELRLRLIESLSENTLIHYTNAENLLSILRHSRIVSDQKNRVFLTQQGMGPREAEQNLFIDSPNHTGRGDFVIMLRRRPGDYF